ncbi:MAG: pectate lyase [Candidatus Azobacteroides sp.]|nr:pectate lyase [Candidatus Azobacteroides sp.]
MQRLFLIFSFLLAGMLMLPAQTPAFPGAYGGGMYTTGGRGGKVLYVTSLADDGAEGTFRWAVNQKGPRIIMFKVSGTISLQRKLSIKNGDLTIAGQSAPGDGICIATHEVTVNADNVIIRYMRFRLGNQDLENESDAIGGRYQNNVILDHCSISWSIDECASFYDNKDFTMQWCIISESLNNAGHEKGSHGYGGIWGGENASFHHNLLAHHMSRNPRFNGWKRSGLKYKSVHDEERVDFRNNVIYNWGDNGSYGGESAGKYNMVANYFKAGPATKASKKEMITKVDMDKNKNEVPPGHGFYYIADNYVYGGNPAKGDDWKYVTYDSGVKKKDAMVKEPFAYTSILQHTAEDALKWVVAYVGASLFRDEIDMRIAQEVMTGTARFKGAVTNRPGLIDTPEDVGGYPVYYAEDPPIDSDNDGIPDGWLEQNYPGKTANELNPEGYTYLEVYLNSLVEEITRNQYTGAKMN